MVKILKPQDSFGIFDKKFNFDILVISWQFEHFWANNWQGINRTLYSEKDMASFNAEYF